MSPPKIAALMVHPDRPGTANNVAGNPAGDQTWVLNARNMPGRLDHSFTPNFKISESFYWNRRPSIRNCGETGGCTTQFDGETEPEKNNNYYGQGFYQRISTLHAHQQFDWVIRNNLLNHSTVAWDRWFMGGNSLSAGVGWPQLLWGANQGGLLDNNAGPPMINFAGNIPYTNIGQNWQQFGYEKNDRWQFSNDLTWVKGRHTAKVGFEYRHHSFPAKGWGTSTGGSFDFNRLGTGGYDSAGNNLSQTGDPFASFLLGQVQQSSQVIPVYPTFRETYTAGWINDEFKVSDALTLTLGLRFDYQFARTERDDRVLDVRSKYAEPGRGQYSRRADFCGKRPGPHREPKVPRGTGQGRLGAAGRSGVSTRRQERHPRRLWNLLLGSLIQSVRRCSPTLGFQANLLAPNLSNGVSPAFYLDDGFPHEPRDTSALHRPCVCQRHRTARGGSEWVDLPRFQNWSMTYQRQLTSNMMLDVSYIGNRGTRLNHHPQTLGVDSNMNDPSVLALGATVLQADINSPTAQAAGIKSPYAGFKAMSRRRCENIRSTRRSFGAECPTGKSQYHAVETVLERRFSTGTPGRVAYTYSRLYNNGAENAQGDDGSNAAVQNPSDPLEWALSADDTPHVFLTGFTWEVPGSGKWSSGVANALLAGWNVSGVLRYESGRPFNITMSNDLGGFLFNGQKRPNRVSGVDAVASRSGGFDPNVDRYFNPAAWTDPGPLQFGNAVRRDGTVRGFPTYSEDLNIFKVFPMADQSKMRVEASIGNIFNRVMFCDPNTNWSSASFGSINTQCNQPRSVQFALRYDF